MSQLWNGFEKLSFDIHYGMGLMCNARVVTLCVRAPLDGHRESRVG